MSQADSRLPVPERATRVRGAVVAMLCGLSFLTYYDRQCIVRAQESIQATLAISDDEMGLVFGAFWLAYALFEIPGGWMGDRMGARITLTRIVLAWSLFTMLTGAATGLISLLAFRFLFGVGEAGAYPNMARAQSRWLPRIERARAGGVLWLCARWGAAFAPLVFGAMTRGIESWQATVDSSSALAWWASLPSWRLAFFASGAVGAVWCVAFYLWFRDEPREKAAVNSAELRIIEAGRGDATLAVDRAGEPRVWRSLATSVSLWAMAGYYICGSFGWSFFVSWMPRYLKEEHGVAFEKSEWSTAWPLLCGGVACLVGGLLSDALVARTGWRRWGRAVFPMSGCLVAAAAMLALRNVSSARDATILMCVAAAAFDFGQAANWAAIVDMGGRHAGIAMGFINMVGNLGNSIQPYAGSRVFNAYGWNALFGVYAVAFLAAMVMWTMINPRRVFYEEGATESPQSKSTST